jgi:hypothetical protein
VLNRYPDPINLDDVKDYFSALFSIEGDTLDQENILSSIREQEKHLRTFHTIAEKFKLIYQIQHL